PRSLPLPPGAAPQGRPRPGTDPRPPPQRRTRLYPVLPGDLPHRQAALRRGPAPARLHLPAAARPVLLLSPPAVAPPPPPLPAPVPLHHPGLRQWPCLAGAATPRRRQWLRPAGQRLHPTRRPDQGSVPGRALPPARLGSDPRPLGTRSEPVARRTVAARPGLLLGH